MRPVPSRRSSILGTLPASRLGAEPIPERLTKVLNESTNYAELPFVPEAASPFLILGDDPAQVFSGAVSYADFARLAVRLLGEAKLEAFGALEAYAKKINKTPDTYDPRADTTLNPQRIAIAVMYRKRTLELLEKLNPYGEFNASMTRPDSNVPAGRVSWTTLSEIPTQTGNLLQDQTSVPKAKAAVKALKQRIDELGRTIGMYDPEYKGTKAGRFWSDLRSPVAPGESFVEAADRWALRSQSQSNAAPSSPLATLVPPTTAPAAASAAPVSSTSDPFAPPAPSASSGSGLPSWALPVAAGVAGVLGLALLFGPSGSSNRD